MSVATQRRAAIADALTTDGAVSARHARSTGALVLVVDTHRGGEWAADSGNPDRWVTYCDTHDLLCTHSTRELAESWASSPETWCSDCGAGWAS